MLGRLLVTLGLILVTIGLVLIYAPGWLGWFGRLPGDINITRDGTRIFVPITSMIIVSIVLTIVLNLLFRR